MGRAGHTLTAVSRGIFLPTFRDDALELLAIVGAMRSGDVEPTRVVQNALDVLAQLIVAIVGSETPEWTADDGPRPGTKIARGASFTVSPDAGWQASIHFRVAVTRSKGDPEVGVRCVSSPDHAP